MSARTEVKWRTFQAMKMSLCRLITNPRRRGRTEPCVCINQLISNYNLSAPLFAVVDFAYDKDV